MRTCWTLVAAVAMAASGGCRAVSDRAEEALDPDMSPAERLVRASDRYLHHSRLAPGMRGYGLTVLSGTKIERFGATVVSVLRSWYPRQDVILCRLSGLGLEKTGVISGMSGSPVYMRDPADGKAKMIGAVAYGWSFQKEPICGVQPIVQMLAIAGAPVGGPGGPQTAPSPASAGTGGPSRTLDEALVQTMLNPRKVRFSDGAPGRGREGAERGAGELSPLATPLMISGATDRTLRRAEEFFAPAGFLPVRAGGVAGAEAEAAAGARLAPGMAVSVPLVTGDGDWAGVGTVTDVIGDYVLAFGHAFNAEGAVELPMGPAYVHGVIPRVWTSFKMGSTLKVTGAVTTDEYTGVGGRIGRQAETIPVTIRVCWGEQEKAYRYRVVRHRRLTTAMCIFLLGESIYAHRELPRHHSLRYDVEVDFGALGAYRAANLSSGRGLSDVASDLERPVWGLMNTELGPPAAPKRIDVTVRIQPVQTTAAILDLKLERNSYRPGQTVRGQVTLRPFRRARVVRPVALELPDDLPDGRYTLTVCDAYAMLDTRRSDVPHRYKPHTVEEFFDALQRVVRPRTDRLYVHLPLPDGGLAVRQQELEHLPGSLAEILARAAPVDSVRYRRRQVAEVPVEHVVSGSAEATFEVRKHPDRAH